MSIAPGMQVEHLEYGVGTVRKVLGSIAVVVFFGEEFDVNIEELSLFKEFEPTVINNKETITNRINFRCAYEAVNLGVVPPDPETLIKMTIGGDTITAQVGSWLSKADKNGLCRVVFGNYGTGKSHYLRLVSSNALKAGWAVSFIEFDPKAADPAKPHLVYRALMSNLKFPPREDGTIAKGFMGLIKEIRQNWDRIRDIPFFKKSPWFLSGLETLLHYPHNEDQDYLNACDWLSGQAIELRLIRGLAKNHGLNPASIPKMPRTKETADIYVFHLVVVHEICKALGYKGLVIILDEAEHVRGYNVRRRERANNFFELLSQSSHLPIPSDSDPFPNEHDFAVPNYWKTGPHFALFVGLTEGDTFSDSTLSLREACVFLHTENDRVYLHPPTPMDYEKWCLEFFLDFYNYYPEVTVFLATDNNRRVLAKALREAFESTPEKEHVIRIWIKLASLIPSILLARNAETLDDLIIQIRKAAHEARGDIYPWELA